MEMNIEAPRIPYIDPNIEHVGISRLRTLNSSELRQLKKTLVLQDNDSPLAVLLGYEQFLIMQRQLQKLLDTIDMLANPEENRLFRAGMNDMQAGKTKGLKAIKVSIGKRR